MESAAQNQSIEVDHRESSDDQGSSIDSLPSHSCQQSEDVDMVNVAVEEITIKEEEIHDIQATTAQNFEDDDSDFDSFDSDATEVVNFDYFNREHEVDLSLVKRPAAPVNIEGKVSHEIELFSPENI